MDFFNPHGVGMMCRSSNEEYARIFEGVRRLREKCTRVNEHPNPLARIANPPRERQFFVSLGVIQIVELEDATFVEENCVVFVGLQNRGKSGCKTTYE